MTNMLTPVSIVEVLVSIVSTFSLFLVVVGSNPPKPHPFVSLPLKGMFPFHRLLGPRPRRPQNSGVLTGIQPRMAHWPIPCPVVINQITRTPTLDMWQNVGQLSPTQITRVCTVLTMVRGQDGECLVNLLTVQELNGFCRLVRIHGTISQLNHCIPIRGPYGLPEINLIADNEQHRYIFTGRITDELITTLEINRAYMRWNLERDPLLNPGRFATVYSILMLLGLLIFYLYISLLNIPGII